jgi:hypothetical protein
VRAAAPLVIALLAGACHGEEAADCPAGDYFTALPVDEAEIASTTVVGGFSPPAHTLPSDHGGVYLARTGVTLRAPGALQIVRLRRTSYLRSSFRAGVQDHAIEARVCGAVDVTIGHVVTLIPSLEALLQPGGCSTYSTANETVEACYTSVDRRVAAGEELGTVGGPSAGAFDFGVYDRRQHNVFANPARFPGGQMVTAICPWQPFTADLRALLLSRVGVGAQRRQGDPPCGTMEVDRPGTAQGIWIDAASASAAPGDESPFVTLSPDLVLPAERLLFVIGLPALMPGSYQAQLRQDGPRNRAFAEVTPGPDIQCYDVTSGVFHPPPAPRLSFLLALGTDGTLRLERREAPEGCDGDPASWTFGAAARTFVR